MKMDDQPRLIEVAFPLEQASIASVHEKNVRHGHISLFTFGRHDDRSPRVGQHCWQHFFRIRVINQASRIAR
jgi:hypothetical protein